MDNKQNIDSLTDIDKLEISKTINQIKSTFADMENRLNDLKTLFELVEAKANTLIN